MGALSADFNSYIKNQRSAQAYIAKTGAVIYKGGLVQLNSDGLALAAAAGQTGIIVGRAAQSLDGTEPAGTKVLVEEGDIFLNLAGSSGVTQATVGLKVYAASDNEINTTDSNAQAGILLALQDGGALVRCTVDVNKS